MKFSPIFMVIISAILFPGILQGQDTIYLRNSSFEDIPHRGGEFTPPIRDWRDCGLSKFPGETPPDLHPAIPPAWNVTNPPFDGYSYLGLVARDNATWESVSQGLSPVIKANKCYAFNASLCLSKWYESRTKKSPDKTVSFSNSLVLLIWGGNSFCDKRNLLAQSPPVDNEEWKEFQFRFYPTENYTYITLEAFYRPPANESYNGNILIDHLSPIIEISCD